MKKNYSDITIVLDRSGSMDSCKDDVIGGFNTLIKAQRKAEGEATVNLYQFDDKYETVYENKNVLDAPLLTGRTFVPRGQTALYDAVGKTIVVTGERYAGMKEEERPEKVFFVVITDGEENDSREYVFSSVKTMIEHQQEKYGWQFVFLGSEVRAVEDAVKMGVKQSHAMHYDKSAKGYDAAYVSISKNITKMRNHAVNNQNINTMNFFEEEDKKAQEEVKKRNKKRKKTRH